MTTDDLIELLELTGLLVICSAGWLFVLRMTNRPTRADVAAFMRSRWAKHVYFISACALLLTVGVDLMTDAPFDLRRTAVATVGPMWFGLAIGLAVCEPRTATVRSTKTQ